MNITPETFAEMADRLTERLHDVEVLFEQLGLRAPGAVLLHDDETILTFKKEDGLYRLMVTKDGEERPLGKASLRTRAQAACAIDALHESLVLKREELIENMADAIDALDGFLARARQ